MASREFTRIGLKLVKTGIPERPLFLGYNAEVRDLDTGRLLPVSVVDLHIAADSIASMTVEITDIYDIEIVDETNS